MLAWSLPLRQFLRIVYCVHTVSVGFDDTTYIVRRYSYSILVGSYFLARVVCMLKSYYVT